jgi:wyosine [tRNA(Phe)-imidazoG37] synthetase (radical SAM superfamily)
VGKTTKLTVKRESFFSPEEIFQEFCDYIDKVGKLDYVTFSGSGEPTLNKDIGVLIDRVKDKTDKPIAVLTNGSLLWMDEVKEDLKNADVIIPSLDTADENMFKVINRPHPSLNINKVIEGIKDFTESFKGEIWLEILLVRGMNDTEDEIKRLAEAINVINPFRVQLSTVTRPGVEDYALPVGTEKLNSIKEELSKLCHLPVEAIREFDKSNVDFLVNLDKAVLKMIAIRPCTMEDLTRAFDVNEQTMETTLEKLKEERSIEQGLFSGKVFFKGLHR